MGDAKDRGLKALTAAELAALKLMKPSEAGELLRLDPATVTRMLRSGAIPGGLPVGARWRVTADALMRYVRGQQARATRMQGG